jgi:predicted small secreted protein
MHTRIFITAVTLLALLAGMLTGMLTGCNTWKGAGKDVERTGEVMQGD